MLSASTQASANLQKTSSSQVQPMINQTSPNIFPENIISSKDLTDDELQPHFFTPDFLRPIPQPENQELMDEEDFDEACWLIPGMIPEPYWDINMG